MTRRCTCTDHETCDACIDSGTFDRRDAMTDVQQYIIIVGNPIDGLRIYGPYIESDLTYAVEGDDDWWICPLRPGPPQ